MTDDIVLSVQGLKKYYPVRGGIFQRKTGQVYAVDDVSFDIKHGETLGLVGESGCGKSTVAKTLLRLYEPTAGAVTVNGVNINTLGKRALREQRKDIQIVFQDPSESLNSRHTVRSLLSEPFIIHGIGTVAERKRWVTELLAKVGLPEDSLNRFPHEFSGGQKQRIGIARAIALKPKILICDEPVSALDVSVQSQILNLLLELQKEMQLTILFIAHDLAVVKHISDKIAVMYLGEIVEIADADTLYENPQHPYTQSLIASIPIPKPDKTNIYPGLQGEIPSPLNPPTGCRFHTRCQYAESRCKKEKPILRDIKAAVSSHQAACHLLGSGNG